MNDRQPLAVPQGLERGQRRMQAKETVEVDCRFGIRALWFRNRNRWPLIVIGRFTKRHDHIQTINRATLKDSNQGLPPAAGDAINRFRQRCALQK